jgi:two-component system cell cycle response regulator
LDDQVGLLLQVRIASVVLVVLGALFAPGTVGLDAGQVWPLCAGFMIVAGLAETWRRSPWPGRTLVHRMLIPVDGLFLAVVTAAAGGPHSPLIVLFAVQIASVTILAGARTGVTTTLWDTLLFVVMPTASLTRTVAGVLGVHHVRVPSVAATAVAIVGFWAVATTTAAFSTVRERELRRGKDEVTALAAMAAELEGLIDEEQILAVLLATLLATFPLRSASVWYVAGDRPIGLVAGPDTGPARRLEEAPPGGLPGVLAVPLRVDGSDAGVVFADHGGSRTLSDRGRRQAIMLEQFVGHAGLVLRNARLHIRQARLAAMDGLTGLANRREFDAVMSREASRARRSGEPLSVVVFDVDHFKNINDTRGHLAGDEVLRALATVMQASVRDMDLVARYGGEEFAVVLPRCDQHDAILVVERITRAVAGCEALRGVTVSSGVATMPFNAHDGRSLVAAADEALYESKRAGRNRYSVSARRPDPERAFLPPRT